MGENTSYFFFRVLGVWVTQFSEGHINIVLTVHSCEALENVGSALGHSNPWVVPLVHWPNIVLKLAQRCFSIMNNIICASCCSKCLAYICQELFKVWDVILLIHLLLFHEWLWKTQDSWVSNKRWFILHCKSSRQNVIMTCWFTVVLFPEGRPGWMPTQGVSCVTGEEYRAWRIYHFLW